MFTLASKAIVSPSSGAPLALIGVSFQSPTSFNSGTWWGGTVSWSGGVAPFTVQLLRSGTVVATSTGNTGTSKNLTAVSDSGWNGATMTMRVTDSSSATVTTSGQSVTVYYKPSGSVTVSGTSPRVGQMVSCYFNIMNANPSPSYQWYYRSRSFSGATWGSWNAWGTASTMVSGTFTFAWEQWEFYCVASNSAGSTTFYTPTVTVQP